MRLVRVDPPAEVVACGVLCGATAPPSTARRMDRYAALGCAASAAALARPHVERPRAGDPTWGVILGSSLACTASNAEYLRELAQRPREELSPALFARTIANAVNGEISIAHGLGGISHTFVSGWAAGAEALAEAAALLSEGRIDRVLAGGIEAPDATVAQAHAARRRGAGLDWLPETLEQAAAVCLLARAEARTGRPRIVGYGRGHDPGGRWSLEGSLAEMRTPRVETVVSCNAVAPEVEQRWRRQAGGRSFVQTEGRLAASGAAAIACVLADVAQWCVAPGTCALLVARDVAGGTAALVVSC